MKYVLEIIGKLYIGGAEKVARDIGFYADKAQYQIDYVVFENDIGVYEEELLSAGCRIFHLNPPSCGYRQYIFSLKKIINENHYDVIHAHTMFNSGWAMWLGKKLNVPIRIAHSHTIRTPEKRALLQRIYEWCMRKIILQNATHYVGCGVKAGNWLFGEKAFSKRGITILNGIDTQRFTYSEECRLVIRRKLGIEDSFVIGHAGHLSKVKNQSFLISLLPEIKKKVPHAVLLLLGDGEDKEMLKQQAEELGVSTSIIMTGNVPDVFRYLSAMDVFAFPSLYEGMPLSIVEVQANGLPCVISNNVPRDIHISDLVHSLPLDASVESWVNIVCTLKRKDAEGYASELKSKGFDKSSMLERIYDLYNVL